MASAKLSTALISVLVFASVLANPAMAQQKLGDLVSEGGYDWIIGNWEVTTDEGETVTATWKWVLDKHAIAVSVKISDGFEYQGLIYLVATEEKVVQIGADNRGGIWNGVWGPDGDRALLTIETKRPDGEIRKMGMAHSWVDAKTMKVEIYGFDGDYMSYEPSTTLNYKRKAEKKEQK